MAASVVLDGIVAAGGAMRDLVDNWYRVPQVLAHIDTRLESLRVEKHNWEAQIHRLGLAEDQELKDLFGRALSNLQELQTRLEAKKPTGLCGGCLAKLKWSCFPAELQEIVNRVTDCFDEVLRSLKNQMEIEEVLQKRVQLSQKQALNKPPSFERRPDRRYVRLERTREKVMIALRKSDGPPVVVLQGGPGTGKSSLATDVAHEFQQGLLKPQASDSSPVFEQVVFLECGSHFNLQAKQSELKEKLGWSTSGDEAAHAESDFTVKNTLSYLLRKRKLLVILDDIWESGSNFLQYLIDIGGKNVKWFITSQLQLLCNNLNCKEFVVISMEEVAQDDARRILAAHIQLPETVISEVKGFMDPVIDQVNGNLLALTCIAPAIDPSRYNQKHEWLQLGKKLSRLLDSVPENKFQSKEYGRSYWEAVQVGFNLLSMPAQNLIFLMYLCKGPSIREGIIEYLFEHTSDRYQSFSQARRELQGRGLVKMTDGIEGEESMCSWSVHSLLKTFIKLKYFVDKDDNKLATLEMLSNRSIVFDQKVSCRQDSNVLIVMGALYFENEFSEELINKYSTQVDILRSTLQLAGSRGYVIEPVAQLLIQSEDEEWTSALHSASEKVFLEYSRRGVIDQDGTSTLLSTAVSKACMLMTLSRYREIEPRSFFGQIVVSSLVQLLETECVCMVSGDPNGATSLGVRSLSEKIAFELYYQLKMDEYKLDDHDKLRFSNVIEKLKDGLVQSALSDIQVCSATILADLVVQNKYISNKVVAAPGLLEELVKAIRNDGHKALQRIVAFVLVSLSTNEKYIALKIVSCNGTLEALVAGLKKEDNVLQYWCAATLGNLANKSSRIGLEILNCGGALEALTTGLRKEKSGRLANVSILALVHLAYTSGEAKWKIVNVHGLLDYFVSVTTGVYTEGAAENNDIIYLSAILLRRLAVGGNTIRAEMKSLCPGILQALTNAGTMLSNDGANKVENDRGGICREIMTTMTLLDPKTEREMHYAYMYSGRGFGMLTLGHYQKAVEDLDTCAARLRGSFHIDFSYFLEGRCCAKAKTGDLQGALADANLSVEVIKLGAVYCMRGIVKRMMEKLHEALADLDESICLDPDSFEGLKHRGFVKYLLQDIEGAKIDAQLASQARKDYGDEMDYDSDNVKGSLRFDIVRYLDFEL